MRPGAIVRAKRLWSIVLLAGVSGLLVLTSCTQGEAVMPEVAPGLAADRSAGVVAPVPAPIPHTLDGRSECFACHAIGAVDAPAVPPDHDQDVTQCANCHAVWLAPVIAAAVPPAIPHELEGREDCLTCHKVGTADAPRIPDNHSDLSSAMCQACHSTVGEIAGGDDVAAVSGAEAPPIPHALEGFGACTQCHEKGGSGIPIFPEDHVGRTDDLCSACHSPAAKAAESTSAETETAEPTPTKEVTAIATETAEPTPATEVTSTPTEAAEPTPTTEVTATATEAAEPTSTREVVTTATEAPPAEVGDAANGEVIFAANCALCHGPSGEGTAIAPEALNDAEFLAEHTDDDLSEVITEGEGGRMPAFPNLSDQDVLDLVALLRSWQ
jgi:cytochrome c5